MAPTEHGEAPITAVHDPGLVVLEEVAWWSSGRRASFPAIPVRFTFCPNRAHVRGHLQRGGGRRGDDQKPSHAGGRAGFWGLDSAAPPLVAAGRFVAARATVDVAFTTVDLWCAERRRRWPVPAAGRPRPAPCTAAILLNNAAIAAEAIVTATGERVAILDVDYRRGNGSQGIFWRRGDVRYVSNPRRPGHRLPVFPGPGGRDRRRRRGRGERQPAPPPGTGNAAYLAAVDRALEAIAAVPGSVVVVSLGFDPYGLDPIGSFALTTDVYHEIGRRTAALGRRLVILQEGGYHRPSLERERPGVAAQRRGPPVRPAPAGGLRSERGGGRLGWRPATTAGHWTPARLAHAVDQLAARDADLAAIVARFGPPPFGIAGRASGRCCTWSLSSRSRSPLPRPPTTGSGSPPIR